MNNLKISLFILHLFLETSVFPDYLLTYLNSKRMFFYILLIGGFLTCFTLKKFSKVTVLVLLLADFVFGLYLVKTFYNEGIRLSDEIYVMIIYFIIITIFLYSNSGESYKQFKSSENLKTFIFSLLNLISSYLFFYHFKSTHLKAARELSSFDTIDIKLHLTECGIDFLIFFNLFSVVCLLKYLTSKTKKKIYIFEILKRLRLLIIITLAFYVNYNNFLNNLIYTKFNEIVPQPHNIVIYNSMPLDPDMRFRIIVSSLLYLIL